MSGPKSLNLSRVYPFFVQIGHVLSDVELTNDGFVKLFTELLRVRCKHVDVSRQMGISFFQFVKITVFYLQRRKKCTVSFCDGNKIVFFPKKKASGFNFVIATSSSNVFLIYLSNCSYVNRNNFS